MVGRGLYDSNGLCAGYCAWCFMFLFTLQSDPMKEVYGYLQLLEPDQKTK
jgi:hypothetical protein